jgi:hypothetical protein
MALTIRIEDNQGGLHIFDKGKGLLMGVEGDTVFIFDPKRALECSLEPRHSAIAVFHKPTSVVFITSEENENE